MEDTYYTQIYGYRQSLKLVILGLGICFLPPGA